jgi:hypothetical protein
MTPEVRADLIIRVTALIVVGVVGYKGIDSLRRFL